MKVRRNRHRSTPEINFITIFIVAIIIVGTALDRLYNFDEMFGIDKLYEQDTEEEEVVINTLPDTFKLETAEASSLTYSDGTAYINIFRDELVHKIDDINDNYIQQRGYTPISVGSHHSYVFDISDKAREYGCWVEDEYNQVWQCSIVFPTDTESEYKTMFFDYTDTMEAGGF